MKLSYTVFILITAVTMVGDYFLKLASDSAAGFSDSRLYLGAAMYALSAFGWLYLMRENSLAAIGVIYSASNILILSGLGYFVFKEPAGLREILGMALAIAAIVLMENTN